MIQVFYENYGSFRRKFELKISKKKLVPINGEEKKYF